MWNVNGWVGRLGRGMRGQILRCRSDVGTELIAPPTLPSSRGVTIGGWHASERAGLVSTDRPVQAYYFGVLGIYLI